jgi:hypothetical protein
MTLNLEAGTSSRWLLGHSSGIIHGAATSQSAILI